MKKTALVFPEQSLKEGTMITRTLLRKSSLALGLAALLAGGACGSGDCEPESGTICTIAGTGLAGFNGDGQDGRASDLYLPMGSTVAPDGHLYLIDWNNHRIRRLRHDDHTVETVAGNGLLGDGPEGPAIDAAFNHPTQVLFDRQGRMVIAAWHNSKIKRVDLTTGLMEDVCGTGGRAYAGDGGPARVAILDLPAGIALDSEGNLLVMDQANQVIRMIDQSDIITTVAGQCVAGECEEGEDPVPCPGENNKTACGLERDPDVCSTPCLMGFAGDGGLATEMRMAQPFGQSADPAGKIVLDTAGNLYFADTRNHRIRVIDSEGIVHTVAGTGTAGYAGDGGPAIDAELNNPVDIKLGSDGTLYIADTYNSCIRAVSPDGIMSTFAGVCGQRGFDGDGGDPTLALLDMPYGIELDRNDNVYIADTFNHVFRMVMR